MSIELLFEELRGQQPPAPFAPAELVRRRGRQRAHRQALTASTAVLAVAGAGVGMLASVAGPPEPPVVSPPPSTSSSAAPVSPPPSGKIEPTLVPSNALLRREDLGPGDWREISGDAFEGSDIWTWADACPAYVPGRYESLRHRPRMATVTWAKSNDTVTQHVDFFADGWGARNLADVRSVLALCASSTPPPDVAPSVYEVVDTGFAGDDSLLVKLSQYYYEEETIAPTPFVSYLVVIRVGDTVSTIRTSGSEAYARSLAERAAALLR